MFWGYIDESGDETTGLCTLSCLVGHWSNLFWFENDWQRILEKKNRQLNAEHRQTLSRFHATDWSTKRREFEGWSDEEKISFINEFLFLFHRYPVVGTSETLRKQDLIEVFPEAKSHYDQLAYSILLTYIVLYIDSKVLGDKRYLTDRIALIHDETQHRGVVKDTFEGLKRDLGVSHRDRWTSIDFKSSGQEVLLQAADLLAYENFKVIERKMAGYDMRKPMKRILGSPNFGGRNASLPKAALQEFRNKLDKASLERIFRNARIINR